MTVRNQEQAVLGEVEWHDALPSTNSELLDRVRTGTGVECGHILAVHHQTAGRGRQQRVWQTGRGRDLTFSFLWPSGQPERMVSLPMAVALAVADLLGAHGIDAQTKWPNDVLVDGGKICGLLAETAADGAGRSVGVVVGVGLNVNMTKAQADAIDRPATSMQLVTGRRYDVPDMLEQLRPLLEARLKQWREGGFAAMRPDWEARAVWLNRPVELHTDTGPLFGVLRGYGNAGELLLEVHGKLCEVWSAELMRVQDCS